MEKAAPLLRARRSSICCANLAWMAAAWPSSAIWKFCHPRNGTKRGSRLAIATRLCSLSAAASNLDAVENVAHLCFLGLQVCARSFGDARLAGNSLDYANAGLLELANFFWIVGEQADFLGAKLLENLRRKIIVACVDSEAQFLIAFDCIHAAILQFVGAELVHQADAAPFLWEIEQDSRGCLADFFER